MNSPVASYDTWHTRHAVDEAADAPWHLAIRKRINPQHDLAGKRILEIGCGRGGFACWLATQPDAPREVVAADFSPKAVKIGREFAESRGVSHVDWQVADIQNLHWPDREFDTLFSFETIEHVPDPPRALAELSRVLKPGGRLFLTTPNYLGTYGLYRAYCRIRRKKFDEGGQPICQLTLLPRTRSWVKRAGLRIIDWGSVGQYLLLPRRLPIEVPFAEHPRWLMRWFGHHSFLIAEKV